MGVCIENLAFLYEEHHDYLAEQIFLQRDAVNAFADLREYLQLRFAGLLQFPVEGVHLILHLVVVDPPALVGTDHDVTNALVVSRYILADCHVQSHVGCRTDLPL